MARRNDAPEDAPTRQARLRGAAAADDVILVTGGLGMIGAHTAATLADLGESVLVTAHRHREPPDFVAGRVEVVPVDVHDAEAVVALGRGRDIRTVVHLAGSIPGEDPTDFVAAETRGLLAVLAASRHWGVERFAVASSLGVYAGRPEQVWTEDLALPTTPAPHLIVAFKKAAEPLVLQLTQDSGIQPVILRIGSTWGPLMDPWSPLNPVMPLVNALLAGREPPPFGPGDGGDCCYAPDAGRAIAGLVTAPRLEHAVYNVSSGTPARLADIAEAARRWSGRGRIPADGSTRGTVSGPYLDTRRLVDATGFSPRFSVSTAVAHYADWRAQHAR